MQCPSHRRTILRRGPHNHDVSCRGSWSRPSTNARTAVLRFEEACTIDPVKTRQSRLVFFVLASVLGAGGLTGGVLLGCSDDSSNPTATPDAGAANPDGAPATTADSGKGNPPPGAPPGTPDGVVATSALVTTLAGSGTAGFANGTGAAASFNTPTGLALDKGGNVVVADSLNFRIRKVTPAGSVSTAAGNGDAGAFADDAGAMARFDGPTGVAVDDKGNVYVADSNNNRIRKVTADGDVTTFAGSGNADHFDGNGTSADFNGPQGVGIADTQLFVADTKNHRIRNITIDSQDVVSVAGGSGAPNPSFANGSDSAALFNTPTGIAVDPNGVFFIADSLNHRIRKLDGFVVSTPAGTASASFSDGAGSAATFNTPTGVAVDASGNVYIADSKNNRIRKMTVDGDTGTVTTVAGGADAAFVDGAGELARFSRPMGVAVDTAGNVYVADADNHRIRNIYLATAGQLVVSWATPTSGGPVTGFKVTGTAAGQPDATCSTTAATMCTLGGLTSGVAYSITVVASSGSIVGTPSAPVTGTPK